MWSWKLLIIIIRHIFVHTWRKNLDNKIIIIFWITDSRYISLPRQFQLRDQMKKKQVKISGVNNYCRRIVATVCTRSFVRANLAVCFNCLRLIGDCNDLLTNFTLNRTVDEFYPTRISIPTDPIPKIGPFLQLPLLFALRGDQRGQ